MIEGALVALLTLENSKMSIETLLFERVEVAGEIVERIGPHSGR